MTFTRHQENFLRVIEYFRTVVLPAQGQNWSESLPMIPLVTTEIKDLVRNQQHQNEWDVLARLATLGSASADILVHQLQLTREALRKALDLLREDRAAQVNLLGILSATRFKVLTNKGLFRTKCPKKLCFSRDSFQHMTDCYHLSGRLAKGTEVVPFLVHMARVTQIPKHQAVIPYPEAAVRTSWL